MILIGILILISFVTYVEDKEPFDINIRIGFKKSQQMPKPKPRGVRISPSRPAEPVPTEYNLPEGAKMSNPNYKPMLSNINTQMLRAGNDDDYGKSGDVGIQRGS